MRAERDATNRTWNREHVEACRTRVPYLLPYIRIQDGKVRQHVRTNPLFARMPGFQFSAFGLKAGTLGAYSQELSTRMRLAALVAPARDDE